MLTALATLDAIALATRTEPSANAVKMVAAEVGYEVDPDLVYPIALRHLRAIIRGDAEYPDYLVRHVEPARALPESAFAAALLPLRHVPAGQHADRRQALESARLVYTSLLKRQTGKRIGVKILRRDRWVL